MTHLIPEPLQNPHTIPGENDWDFSSLMLQVRHGGQSIDLLDTVILLIHFCDPNQSYKEAWWQARDLIPYLNPEYCESSESALEDITYQLHLPEALPNLLKTIITIGRDTSEFYERSCLAQLLGCYHHDLTPDELMQRSDKMLKTFGGLETIVGKSCTQLSHKLWQGSPDEVRKTIDKIPVSEADMLKTVQQFRALYTKERIEGVDLLQHRPCNTVATPTHVSQHRAEAHGFREPQARTPEIHDLTKVEYTSVLCDLPSIEIK